MKKIFAIIIAASMVLTCFACFAVSADETTTTDETIYNLIPEDGTIDYTAGNGFDATATFDENGALTVTAAGGWPGITLTYATPYTFDIAKATLRVKFTLSGGGTSLRLATPDSDAIAATNEIFVHHYIADATFDGAGDFNTPGTYEFEIPFSELSYCDWTAATTYTGKIAITTDSITLSSIQIYSVVGATVVIDTLEVVVEGDEIIDVSDETSDDVSDVASEAVSEETSETETPETGDSGMIALAIISVISLAGAVIFKKK